MAPPSKLSVATSALSRLVNEEASYHKEMEQQENRIKKWENNLNDENAAYYLKQERQGLEETKAVLPTLQLKITKALQNLEEQLENNKEAGGKASTEDITKAKEAIAKGKESLREIA